MTNRKKRIAGVEALVLRDTVTQRDGGGFVEVTDDWYAQDKEGNVWYLGEDTKEYKNGKVSSTKGSWEHGVDGAYAGIIMPAKPRPGMTYRQEYYEGRGGGRRQGAERGRQGDRPVRVLRQLREDAGHDCRSSRGSWSTSTTPGESGTCCAPPRTAAGAKS